MTDKKVPPTKRPASKKPQTAAGVKKPRVEKWHEKPFAFKTREEAAASLREKEKGGVAQKQEPENERAGPKVLTEDEIAAFGDEDENYISALAHVIPEAADPAVHPWLVACRRIDKAVPKGQKRTLKPLLELIREVVPARAYRHIEDLFTRYHLVRANVGIPRAPSYEYSRVEEHIDLALEEVKELIQEGKKQSYARELAAEMYGIPPDILEDAEKGKRTSRRREKQRRIP
ncbi:hypothetical protein AMST5_02167 [freshwater sediment metagenome]|uniref:Uncharacterized protein n=1 Tax=freshwater sediment metagenome TaxID=556182 RepID=A0AA48LZJ1_9ZZZZ